MSDLKTAIYFYGFTKNHEVAVCKFRFREDFSTDEALRLADYMAYIAPDIHDIWMISNRYGLRDEYRRACKLRNQEWVMFHMTVAKEGIQRPCKRARRPEDEG